MGFFTFISDVFHTMHYEVMRIDSSEYLPIVIIAVIFFKIGYWISCRASSFIGRGLMIGIGSFLFYQFYIAHDTVLINALFYLMLGMYLPHIAYYFNLSLISLNIIVNWYYIGITLVYKIIRFIKWVFSPFERLRRYWKKKNYHKSDEFKRDQERFYQEEQWRYDEQTKKNHEEAFYKYKERENERVYNQGQKKEEQDDNKHVRFFSDNHYMVLGVDIESSFKEVKKSYRKLVREYHPDLNPEFEKEYTVIVQRINGAYEFFEKKNKLEPF